MKDLLVPIDFSEVTDAVLDTAAQLAKALPARIRLIHVAAPEPEFVGFDAGPKCVRDQRAATLRDEHRELEVIAEGLRTRGVEATSRLIRGRTVEKILDQADVAHPAFMVIGAHGRGAMFEVLFGSVTKALLKQAHCPLVVAPPTAT